MRFQARQRPIRLGLCAMGRSLDFLPSGAGKPLEGFKAEERYDLMWFQNTGDHWVENEAGATADVARPDRSENMGLD